MSVKGITCSWEVGWVDVKGWKSGMKPTRCPSPFPSSIHYLLHPFSPQPRHVTAEDVRLECTGRALDSTGSGMEVRSLISEETKEFGLWRATFWYFALSFKKSSINTLFCVRGRCCSLEMNKEELATSTELSVCWCQTLQSHTDLHSSSQQNVFGPVTSRDISQD